MSWTEFLQSIEEELGKDVAQKVEDIGRKKFGGVRMTVFSRRVITPKMIDETAPGKPKEAARKLGVSVATIYRAINARRIIR